MPDLLFYLEISRTALPQLLGLFQNRLEAMTSFLFAGILYNRSFHAVFFNKILQFHSLLILWV